MDEFIDGLTDWYLYMCKPKIEKKINQIDRLHASMQRTWISLNDFNAKRNILDFLIYTNLTVTYQCLFHASHNVVEKLRITVKNGSCICIISGKNCLDKLCTFFKSQVCYTVELAKEEERYKMNIFTTATSHVRL